MVTSAKGKQDFKNWHRYFSVTLFEFWYERNDDFFFSHKNYLQKQSFADVLSKNLFLKFLNIHKKTPEGLKTCNVIKKRLQNWCCSCDYWAIFKNTFFTAHLCWLLLYTESMSFQCLPLIYLTYLLCYAIKRQCTDFNKFVKV